jgi:hypothetical protein
MFMTAATASAEPSLRPEPQQVRPVAVADTTTVTGRCLDVLRRLISYAKDLAATVQQRGVEANFGDVVRDFCTVDLKLILAHIARALLLAAAVEDRLVIRAEREAATAAKAATHPQPQAPSAPPPPPPSAPRTARTRRPRIIDVNPLLAGLPTPEQIAAELRRRPLGDVLADICRDLHILPGHPLWQELNFAIWDLGGNATGLLSEMIKRPLLLLPPGVDPHARLIPPMPQGWQPPARRPYGDSGTGPP